MEQQPMTAPASSAFPSDSTSNPQSQHYRVSSRSCHACHAKKIRCDKQEPCSACKRNGKQCTYPPRGPRKRRPKKTIMAEMAARISDLERSLAKSKEEGSKGSPGSISDSSPETTTQRPLSSSDAVDSSGLSRASDDILIQKGSSSQYFNEIILSRVIGGEQSEESDPKFSQKEHLNPPMCSPFNALGILSCPSSSTLPASRHPSKHLAVRLWRIYVDNVEGWMGLKVSHIPTDEVKVYSTIDDPSSAPPQSLAFNFAIYFAAIVSMDDLEAVSILGMEKTTLLVQIKDGLEQSFAHGDFLNHPTIVGLHALAIYLSALRVHNHGKGIWILDGLAIRIAQSLGLHCDGKRLGLSCFQAEIRRRLWWHLICRDGRAGEDYGLEDTNSLLISSDVTLPANIDDMEICPDMLQSPVAKKGWTPMTFTLIYIELAKSLKKLAYMAKKSSPLTEQSRLQVIKEAKDFIDQSLLLCNPVIPQHRQTLCCSRFLLQKLDFITRIQWIIQQGPGSQTNFATEQNISDALEILKPSFNREDDLLSQFAWARKAYPQYHVTMYVLWHLCLKPDDPRSDEAWEAMEYLFSNEFRDEYNLASGSKTAALWSLRAKALSVRSNMGKGGQDGHIIASMGVFPARKPTREPVVQLDVIGNNDPNIDVALAEWSDWDVLAHGFQFDNPDVLWQ